jgi:hypothetical protein
MFLRHAEMPSASLPWRDLPREYGPVAHNIHAFQKVERERSFVEDSLRMKAKEIGSDGHCIHGFNDGEAHRRGRGAMRKKGGEE